MSTWPGATMIESLYDNTGIRIGPSILFMNGSSGRVELQPSVGQGNSIRLFEDSDNGSEYMTLLGADTLSANRTIDFDADRSFDMIDIAIRAERTVLAIAGVPGYVEIREDASNGTDGVRLTAPSSLEFHADVTLPNTDVTLSGRHSGLDGGTAVGNTFVETASRTLTLAANSMLQGKKHTVKFGVRVFAKNAAETLIVRLRLGGVGGTLLLATNAVNVAVGDIVYGEFTFFANGAPGAAVGVLGYGSFSHPAAAGAPLITANLTTTNHATNGTLDLVVTCEWSAASALNSATAELVDLEVG